MRNGEARIVLGSILVAEIGWTVENKLEILVNHKFMQVATWDRKRAKEKMYVVGWKERKVNKGSPEGLGVKSAPFSFSHRPFLEPPSPSGCLS